MRYRVGIESEAMYLAIAPERRSECRYMMCLEGAPVEWHERVLLTFEATSWAEACRRFELWVLREEAVRGLAA